MDQTNYKQLIALFKLATVQFLIRFFLVILDNILMSLAHIQIIKLYF